MKVSRHLHFYWNPQERRSDPQVFQVGEEKQNLETQMERDQLKNINV